MAELSDLVLDSQLGAADTKQVLRHSAVRSLDPLALSIRPVSPHLASVIAVFVLAGVCCVAAVVLFALPRAPPPAAHAATANAALVQKAHTPAAVCGIAFVGTDDELVNTSRSSTGALAPPGPGSPSTQLGSGMAAALGFSAVTTAVVSVNTLVSVLQGLYAARYYIVVGPLTDAHLAALTSAVLETMPALLVLSTAATDPYVPLPAPSVVPPSIIRLSHAVDQITPQAVRAVGIAATPPGGVLPSANVHTVQDPTTPSGYSKWLTNDFTPAYNAAFGNTPSLVQPAPTEWYSADAARNSVQLMCVPTPETWLANDNAFWRPTAAWSWMVSVCVSGVAPYAMPAMALVKNVLSNPPGMHLMTVTPEDLCAASSSVAATCLPSQLSPVTLRSTTAVQLAVRCAQALNLRLTNDALPPYVFRDCFGPAGEGIVDAQGRVVAPDGPSLLCASNAAPDAGVSGNAIIVPQCPIKAWCGDTVLNYTDTVYNYKHW